MQAREPSSSSRMARRVRKPFDGSGCHEKHLPYTLNGVTS
jgi:hypothetical protein